MIDRSHELALVTQARLLGVARATVSREPQPVPASDLTVQTVYLAAFSASGLCTAFLPDLLLLTITSGAASVAFAV